MSSSAPDPCLLAIMLVVSTAHGPRFVCHYPPDPKLQEIPEAISPPGSHDSDTDTDADTDTDTDTSADMDTDKGTDAAKTADTDTGTDTDKGRSKNKGYADKDTDRADVADTDVDKDKDMAGRGGADSEHKVLGFATSFLESFLCPSREQCNAKFEVTVDGLVFLGIPVHILRDNVWKRRRRSPFGEAEGDTDKVDTDRPDTDRPDTSRPDTNADTDTREKSPLRLFHVCFAMNPPVCEYTARIEEMYHYVLSGFVRALRLEQAKSNYVWKEVRTMLRVREDSVSNKKSVRDQWRTLRTESSLARTMADIFDAISSSQVANVLVNNKRRLFQIPLYNSLYTLPSVEEPCTANTFLSSSFKPDTDMGGHGHGHGQGHPDVHLALVLLEDVHDVVHSVKAAPNSALANFIRLVDSTQSLLQMSEVTGWPLSSVRQLSASLIYWRKAKALPVVSHLNTYVVSPLCPVADIYKHGQQFRTQFQTLPSLFQILSILSQRRPKPWFLITPSSDHLAQYMDALIWLLRHGFVMQLHTFVWIKVPRHIKVEVLRADRDADRNADRSADTGADRNADTGTDKSRVQTTTDNTVHDTASCASAEGASARSDSASSASASLRFGPREEVILEEEVILHPDQCSGVERTWINQISGRLDSESAALFARVYRYFDGEHAVDMILWRHNISHDEFRRMFRHLSDYTLTVRHW